VLLGSGAADGFVAGRLSRSIVRQNVLTLFPFRIRSLLVPLSGTAGSIRALACALILVVVVFEEEHELFRF
jgi:hypothetical protein